MADPTPSQLTKAFDRLEMDILSQAKKQNLKSTEGLVLTPDGKGKSITEED